MIPPGTDLILGVDKPTAGGRMLARHEGLVVLVWGAIPGERVRARVERAGKGVVYAETIQSRRVQIAASRAACSAAATSSRMGLPRQTKSSENYSRRVRPIGRVPCPRRRRYRLAGARLPPAGAPARARWRLGCYREGTQRCVTPTNRQLLPATKRLAPACDELLSTSARLVFLG